MIKQIFLLRLLWFCMLFQVCDKSFCQTTENRFLVRGGVGISSFSHDGSQIDMTQKRLSLLLGGCWQHYFKPTSHQKHWMLQTTVQAVSKGAINDGDIMDEKVYLRTVYLELPITIMYRICHKNTYDIYLGGGGFVAYGLGGKIHAEKNAHWFLGIPVGEQPSPFERSCGMRRWDAGICIEANITTRHWLISANYSFGLPYLWNGSVKPSSWLEHVQNVTGGISFGYFLK